MPGIEIKGRSKIANYRHGGRTGKFGGGRTNLLEQLGRVEAEPSNPNRRAEISRVHGELNRGYAKGGRAGFKHGKQAELPKDNQTETWDKRSGKGMGAIKRRPSNIRKKLIDALSGGVKGKPHSSEEGRRASAGRKFSRMMPEIKISNTQEGLKERPLVGVGGRKEFKKGGSDKKWIQKAVNPKHKGYCTPMTKKTCTPARKALARTFKKKAKTGWS
jgi:hypothetical protein